MADSSWTGYVGMATGLFGALMGYLAYRRSNQIKALDLRLELRKGASDSRAAVLAVRDAIGSSTASRRAVLSANGLFRSSVMNAWSASVSADSAAVDGIAQSIPAENLDYSKWAPARLELELVRIHEINRTLNSLAAKYRDEAAADAAARRQIADRQVVTNAALLRR